MARSLTEDGLRSIALGRQFRRIRGRQESAVLDLFRRLGPIQSQVPRAPFLTASSRLPGISYDAVASLFATYRLVKTTSLRGTVHTTVAEQYPWVNAVARRSWAGPATTRLRLSRLSIVDVWDELERFAADWRPRSSIVDHGRTWIAAHESAASAVIVDSGAGANYLWGDSGMVRRPTDGRWDRRTDTEHRTARAFLDLPVVSPEVALTGLARVHLGSYGPATRRDIAWWSGETLGLVDRAVDRLGDEVVRRAGVDGQMYLDLAEPPRGGGDPGVRLLPEYDGLFCGYAPASRGRFIDPRHYEQVWARANGVFSPVVLAGGRVVAVWRLLGTGPRAVLEVTRLGAEATVADDDLVDQVRAVETVLGIAVADIRRG
jgi:hypothetical protein